MAPPPIRTIRSLNQGIHMSDTTTTAPRPLDNLRAPRPQVASPKRIAGPAPVAPEAAMPEIGIGFATMKSWEFTQRVARAYASSSMVPLQYRLRVPNKKKHGEFLDNQDAIPNTIIALNMADRLGVDPLVVMQNLYVVEGKPSWASTFVISSINSSGRYSTELQFDVTDNGFCEVEYTHTWWADGNKQSKQIKVTVPDLRFVAWAVSKSTGKRVESPEVNMKMAVEEGWYTKAGSKWQTMPGLMGRYRAASFFGRLYTSDRLLGLRTVEENTDIIDAEEGPYGVWEATIDQQVEPAAETSASEVVETAAEQPKGDVPAQITHEPTVTLDDIMDKDKERKKVLVGTEQEAPTEKQRKAAPPADAAPAPDLASLFGQME